MVKRCIAVRTDRVGGLQVCLYRTNNATRLEAAGAHMRIQVQTGEVNGKEKKGRKWKTRYVQKSSYTLIPKVD